VAHRFSEDEEELQDDMRLWLNGDSNVLQCVLVKIIEDPQYKCPLSKYMTDEEIEQQELKAKVGMDEFDGEKYGPIFHTKHQHRTSSFRRARRTQTHIHCSHHSHCRSGSSSRWETLRDFQKRAYSIGKAK
jgi:hypothetical protein